MGAELARPKEPVNKAIITSGVPFHYSPRPDMSFAQATRDYDDYDFGQLDVDRMRFQMGGLRGYIRLFQDTEILTDELSNSELIELPAGPVGFQTEINEEGRRLVGDLPFSVDLLFENITLDEARRLSVKLRYQDREYSGAIDLDEGFPGPTDRVVYDWVPQGKEEGVFFLFPPDPEVARSMEFTITEE